MTERVLNCSACSEPVFNIPARRYRKLTLSGQLPMHAECRRLIEQRGTSKKRGGSRTSEPVYCGGFAGISMQWQTNWQQCKGKPLAKAIVRVDLPSTYIGRVAADRKKEK